MHKRHGSLVHWRRSFVAIYQRRLKSGFAKYFHSLYGFDTVDAFFEHHWREGEKERMPTQGATAWDYFHDQRTIEAVLKSDLCLNMIFGVYPEIRLVEDTVLFARNENAEVPSEVALYLFSWYLDYVNLSHRWYGDGLDTVVHWERCFELLFSTADHSLMGQFVLLCAQTKFPMYRHLRQTL